MNGCTQGFGQWLAMAVMLALGACEVGAGAEPFRLLPGSGVVPGLPALSFAHDPGGMAGIGDRAMLLWSVPEMLPGRNHGFGYTTGAVWARMDIENITDDGFEVAVELAHARLTEVTWFVLEDDRIIARVDAGLRGGDEEARMRYPFISLFLPAGAGRSVYLRVQSDSALWIPLRVFTVSDYVRYAARRDYMDFAFTGTGAAIFLLCLLNAAVMRSRSFLLLSCIVAGFMGYYLVFHGYYVWVGGPWQEWVNRNAMLAMGLFGIWAFLCLTAVYVRRDLSGIGLLIFVDRFSRVLLVGGVALLVFPFRTGVYILLGLLAVCHGLGVAMAFRHVARSRSWMSGMLAGVWALVLGVVFLLFAGSFDWFTQPVAVVDLQQALMLFIFVVFFTMITAGQQAARQEEARTQQAEQRVVDFQLRALRYQLNPHFLFNTLNSIASLSREAPARIPELVRRLALLLRQHLRPEPTGRVPLRQELETVQAYLGIEKVRFEENLEVTLDVPGDLLDCRVPEMLIEPLAENAIKHGMPPEGPLCLTIAAARCGNALVIRVENNGSMAPPRPGGVGTQNIRERLEHLYRGQAHLDLREEAGRVIAEVRLPLGMDSEEET